ncbi:hypothetical protein [Cellulophaga baltica]|uniref:Uncharacterized protein n=1 Tax=Cellulophaga baltica TaxID=76594 RepID=A0A1G7EM42_9FLAO|nr:hypothetical protein [Cellulophaga baltica]SDE64719.1 hypothetical protein SAMN04487992_102403 [Cellulophaga baltica]
MSYTPNASEAKFLTVERFKYSRLETQAVIEKLKAANFADLALLDQIEKEDFF